MMSRHTVNEISSVKIGDLGGAVVYSAAAMTMLTAKALI